MIHDETTVLRAPEDHDAELLFALRNDLEVQALLLSRGRPNSRSRVQEWVNRVTSDPSSVFFVIAAAHDDAAVGFLQVTEMDLVDGHGALGIVVHRDHSRRGHARAAIRLVGPYLREVFGLRKLVLDVRADNEAAIALYASTGFREVGVWRSHHRVGDDWVDVMSMEAALVR